MTSHILMPQLDAENPATLSPQILNGLLRGELGFEGVIVTDALDMKGASGVHGIPEAAVRALAAGCDLLCIGADNTAAQMMEIVEAAEAAIDSGRLPAERVRESAARVRALAADAPLVPQGPALAGSIEPPHDATELGRVIAAFEVSDVARARLAEAPRIGTVVRIDTVANIAVGVAPWGPFAAEDAAAHPSWLGDAETIAVSEHHGLAAPAALSGPVLVVGKDLHRHAFARAAIDAVRAVRDDVLTIDMGWPSNDRAYADVATFGASRLLGEAVIEFVDDALRAAVAAP